MTSLSSPCVSSPSPYKTLPPPPTSLESLPAEVLVVILSCSAEASLIHTSRMLRAKLPRFVHYTRGLVLTALTPLERLPTIDRSEQQYIRHQVFWSFWFTAHHLRQAHQILLRERVHDMYGLLTGNLLPKSHRSKLNVYTKRLYQRSLLSTMDIGLTVSRERVSLRVAAFTVTLIDREGAQLWSTSILEFGNVAPDCLLSPPITLSTILLLREVSCTDARPTDDISSSLIFLNSAIQDASLEREGVQAPSSAEPGGELQLSPQARRRPWVQALDHITFAMCREVWEYRNISWFVRA